MEKKDFFIQSSNDVDMLHGIQWIPDGNPIAILQISHGMMEYINRYDLFAKEAAKLGFLVVGHDHLGHGQTASSEEKLGYFAENHGAAAVIKDLYRITRYTKKNNPRNLPYFLLGHSMGSFFARKYATLYGKEIDGLIIVGTGYKPLGITLIAKALAYSIKKAKGEQYRSELLHKLSLGSYNNKFRPFRTPNDWLSRDEEIVDKYNGDAYCNFKFTASAYYDFFFILEDLAIKKGFNQIPKELPILLASGAEDPVGDFTKGVYKTYHQYKKLGIRNVQLYLYESGRHEILNETNKEDVYREILDWLLQLIK